ncbi:hypothetical protein DB345_05295 [Spartobacteria bacterium LR76]|nr:hypothetical protein DB345_05295 [Spartobacteria bacterium LR76]
MKPRSSHIDLVANGRPEKGVALVIVLALVVLLTGLVVAYFSRSMWDRQLSNSSLHQAMADELTRSAMDIITGDLKQEIANGSTRTTAGATTIYTPVSAAGTMPVRNTPTNPSPTLLRISTATDIGAPGADHPASPAISTTPSANGRSISLKRWNSHYLLPLGNPAKPQDTTPVSSGAEAFTAPGWVYVTNAGPVKLATPDKAVIGRYAYAIYDEGALLDMNVAGYPSPLPYVSGPTMPPSYALKGSLAFADLTQLKDASGNSWMTGAGINSTVGWRDYASLRNASGQPDGVFPALSFSGPSVYPAYVDLAASGATDSPDVRPVADPNGRTDQAFPSRQALIRFCSSIGTENFNPNALQYLGTFSRSLNAPTWSPQADASNGFLYKTDAEKPESANRNIPNVRTKKAFTRADGSRAEIGEVLVNQRFPLNRLALVTDSATAAEGSDIERFFGLTRETAKGEPWVYRGGAASIATLDEVAAQGWEPDFFELLKAAILAGSLGKYSDNDNHLVTKTLDRNKDVQIFQIGANLIDQYDADNHPTVIGFGSFDPIYGTESLPYLNHLYVTIFRPNRGDPQYPTLEGWLQFGLWNPNGNAADQTTDRKYRIIGTDGRAYLEASSGTNFLSAQQNLAGRYLEFTARGSTFAEPQLLIPSSTMTGGVTFAGVPIDATNDSSGYFGSPAQPSYASTTTAVTTTSPCYLVGFYLGSAVNPITGEPARDRTITGNPSDPASLSYYHARNALGSGGRYPTFALQYQDDDGTWRTYESVQARSFYLDHWYQYGFKSCTTWLTGKYNLNSGWGSDSGRGTSVGSGLAFGLTALSAMDPRSKRGGMVSTIGLNGRPIVAQTTIRPNSWANRFDSEPTSNSGYPKNPAGITMWTGWSTNNTFQPAKTADNKAGASSFVTDLDGVVRRADGDESNKVSPLWQVASGTTAQAVRAMRPTMLNRPFRSVGEMGFAMRGDPWKSLNLFSSDSADAALMDFFTVVDEPVVAGRVNLNTASRAVLSAILTGAQKAEDGTTLPPVLSSAEAGKIADLIIQKRASAPFRNVAELATRVGDDLPAAFDTGPTNTSDGYFKTRRESAMRALVDAVDTRTWNLLIDVVAQTGMFAANAPQTEAALNSSFIVQGERRYWLHLAIDRYTGEVIARELEAVYE